MPLAFIFSAPSIIELLIYVIVGCAVWYIFKIVVEKLGIPAMALRFLGSLL